MGWSWRRSMSIGPVRFNFSQSGMGMSVGVKGARVSICPRGTYVHVGAGGFRYSSRIDARNHPNSQEQTTHQSRPLQRGQLRTVENLDPLSFVDVNQDEVLEEIRCNANKVSLVSVVAIISGLLVSLAMFVAMFQVSEKENTGIFILGGSGLLVLAALPYAKLKDKQRLVTHISYEFDPLGANVEKAIVRLVQALADADKIWSVKTENQHGE